MDSGETSFMDKITPTEYVEQMQAQQGERPDAWARSLAQLVIFESITREEAEPYAAALEVAAGPNGNAFRTLYETLLVDR